MNYNLVVLAGRLTRDPEVKYSSSGVAVGSLGIATNRFWTDANGEKKEEATFVDCKAFGSTAETIGKYLRKGSLVLVQGRLSLYQWTTDAGENRSKLSVVVERVQLPPKGTNGPVQTEVATAQEEAGAEIAVDGEVAAEVPSGVPF